MSPASHSDSHNSYHAFADNPYPYPADESESTRLDAFHDVFKTLYGKNVLTPIKNLIGTRFLDLGTGSG